jgi:IS5 family transposase
MRVVQERQMKLGEVDVSQICIRIASRDDIPQVLSGLKAIYCHPVAQAKVFDLLHKRINPTIDKSTGRPGMSLWAILVCGALRLDLNADYDLLQELITEHRTIRLMMGHGEGDRTTYALQTLKDNVSLLTVELLDEINQVVVDLGHSMVGKTAGETLRGRCDSAVVETHVEYPTDIGLLFDATRKVIELTAELCAAEGRPGWRQYRHNVGQVKRLLRYAQTAKARKASSEEQKARHAANVIEAHQNYIGLAQGFLDKSRQTLSALPATGVLQQAACVGVETFLKHADRQIDQIRRRVIGGEVIPHDEKVFSMFQPHTEWVMKGKAGVPVELGLRCAFLEDQYGFILHHQVMEKQTDDQVAVPMVVGSKQRFTDLDACSFDKGFHSAKNQEELSRHLKLVALPRKGKLSAAAQDIENAEDFVKARRQHPAIESAINALEVHGLDRCLDHGIHGFKRYVAMAVVARNIHRLGMLVREKELRREKRKALLAARDPTQKFAA